MATPANVAAGTGASAAAATTTVTPAYPAGMSAGHLMMLQVVTRSTPLDTPTTPSGWTLMWEDTASSADFKQCVYFKTATGSESGTLTVTVNGGNSSKQARIYAVSGTNEAAESAGLRTFNDSVLDGWASVVTADVDRLAVAIVSTRDTMALGSLTGETGGDWTEAYAEYAPLATLQMQTAAMAAAGTLSGGSYTMSGANPYIVRTFALQPSGGAGGAGGRMLLLGVG